MVLAKVRAWSPKLMDSSDDSPEVGWVSIGELHYDWLWWDEDGRPHGYQRPLEEPRIEQYVREYAPHLIGVIKVHRRADGSLWVIDGQHRVEVLTRLGRAVVLAEVYTGLTPEDEARDYNRLNRERKSPNRWNTFGARGSSNDPIILALIDLARSCGFKIGTADRSLQSIAAVGALENVYGWPAGPRLLRQVLIRIATTWPSDVISRDGVFIQGLAHFIFTWDGSYAEGIGGNKIDWRRFDTVFAKVGAVDITRKCKELKIEAGFAMNPNTYALAFREFYNGKSNFGGRLEGKIVHPRPTGGHGRYATTKNRIGGR